MKKHQSECTTEYSPEESTYQTGAAKPHKDHRGLIAVLMILVTFLGGIASALGLVNVRLMQALNQERSGAEHVSVIVDPSAGSTASNPDVAPSLPDQSSLQLPVENVPNNSQQLTGQQIWERNLPSTVTVHCQESTAHGVVIHSSGFILTNASAICDQGAVYVALSDGQRYRAALVGADHYTDLAVLYIEATGLDCAQFGSTIQLTDGDFAAGLTQQHHVITSQVTKRVPYVIGSDEILLLQADLPVLAGPVFNGSGQIIGFASPQFSQEELLTAVPTCTIKEVVEQILQLGSVTGRPWLGVELEAVQPLHQHYFDLPQGLRVSQSPQGEYPDSPLMPGDILVQINGQEVFDHISLSLALRAVQPGDVVQATVIRDNVETTLYLTVQTSS